MFYVELVEKLYDRHSILSGPKWPTPKKIPLFVRGSGPQIHMVPLIGSTRSSLTALIGSAAFSAKSARCNIYISHLGYDVSVRLSVSLSVCDGRALGRGACREEGRDHFALCASHC